MTQFNVPVNPSGDPSYLGLSKPISDLRLQSPLGTLFKGIGDAFEAGVKAVEFKQHEDISKQVRDVTDPAQEALVKDLETTMLKGGRKTESPTALLPYTEEDTTKMPLELTTLRDRADLLQQAIDGKKDSALIALYKGQLHHLSKRLRAQYPGQRAFIDSTIKDATNNPTSDYIRTLTALLGASQTSDERQRAKLITQMDQYEGYPNWKETRRRLREGGPLEDAEEWISKTAKSKATFDELERQSKLNKIVTDASMEDAKRQFDTWAGTVVNNDYDVVMKELGISSNADLIAFLQKRAEGGVTYKTEQIQPVLARLAAARSKMIDFLTQESDRVKDGSSMTNRLGGPEERNKRVAAIISRYDESIKFLVDEKYGLATYTQRLNKAASEDTKNNLINNKEFGEAYRSLQTLSAISPGIADHFYMTQMFKNPKVLEQHLQLLTGKNAFIAAQPDLSTNGTVRSIKENIQEAKKVGVVDINTYKGLLGVVNTITDPKMPDVVKRNVILGAFGEGNKGMTREFKLEPVVPDPKRPGAHMKLPTKYAAFVEFTTSAITDEVARLTNIYPEVGRTYVEWAKHEFGAELFQRDIKDLANIPSERLGIEMGWDSVNKQIALKETARTPKFGLVTDETERAMIKRAEATVNRINIGLMQMKNIADSANKLKAGSVNVDAFLLENLASVDRRAISKMEGLPGQLGAALIRERMLKKQEEERSKGAKRSPFAPGFGHSGEDTEPLPMARPPRARPPRPTIE